MAGNAQGYNHFGKSMRRLEKPAWPMIRSGTPVFTRPPIRQLFPKKLDAASRDMSKEQYEQEFECSFNAAITGAYFGRALGDAIHEGRIGNFPWQPLKPVHTAWDLGIGDSTAIWFFQEV